MAVIGAGLAVAGVAAGVVTAVGTVDEGQSPVAPTPTTHHATTAPTTPVNPTTPPTTTPSPPVQTIPSYGPCPPSKLAQLPRNSGCASLVRGDFDGDGASDTLLGYAHPLDAKGWAKQWHVRFIPGATARASRNMRLPLTQTNLRIVAVLDVNRDGRDDALLDYQDGATTNFLEIAVVSGGHLFLVSGPGGAPFSFGIGGSVLQGSGGGCRAAKGVPEIFDTGYFERGGSFHSLENVYHWRGLTLHRAGYPLGRIDQADIARLSAFHCFGVRWPHGVPPTHAR